MFDTSTDNIIKTAEKFKLPVANRRIYENEVDNYNYIIVREGILRETSNKAFVREIIVAYIYENESQIDDFKIINEFKNIGLKFSRMEPDDFRLEKTNRWIDMKTFIFERPEKDKINV